MKAKSVIPLCNGRRKIAKGRFGGDHKSEPKFPCRHKVLTAILDREVREEEQVEGYHPAATLVPTHEPVDLRNVVVSCGLSRDDDTDGNVGHIFIPVTVPRINGSGRSVSNPRRRRPESTDLRWPRLTSEQYELLQMIERERDRVYRRA